MTPQAVIFDIGNVLLEWQPERYYDRVIGEDACRRLFAEVDLHHMNDIVDRGGDFRETIYGWAERHPEWAEAIRMWHDNWLELAQPRIDHSVRLLRALRANGVPVFALTNFGIGTWAVANPEYEFLSEFDRTYVSGHMGVMKPEAEIYERLEADCGVPPQALLFTDDKPDNIAAANARGWLTHLFTGPEGWAQRLVVEGLLTTDQAR